MPRPSCRLLAVTLLAATAAPARAQDPTVLLKYVPPQANALILINMETLLNTPRARKEGWANLEHTEYLAGAVPINPLARWVVGGKEVVPGAAARGKTFLAVTIREIPEEERLLRTTGGTATTVGDEPAVLTPNGSILVPLDKTVLGVASTDNRQDVTRWMRASKTANGSQMSRYLNAAVYNYLNRPILIALDAEDLIEPAQAARAVANTPAFAGDPETAAAVEKFVAKLRGVVLAVDVTADGLAVSVRFDSGFTKKIKPDAFKAFLVALLDRHGAPLEDLPAAVATAAEGSVNLKFKLSDAELGRIIGLFIPPVPNLSLSQVIPGSPGATPAGATTKYVRGVNRILDDLKQQSGRKKDFAKMEVWQDAAANRIETLSVLTVDPPAVDYGRGTAARLRAISDSLRGLPIQLADLANQQYTGPSSRGLVFTGAGPRLSVGLNDGPTNAPQIYARQVEAIQKDEVNRTRLWSEITRQRMEMRKYVLDKYMMDPETPAKK